MKRGGRWGALLAFFLALVFVLPGLAQTNELQSAPLANRYLLVVETSRSMQRRAAGTLNALTDLLNSGFGGQIHAGDTLGVWTFGEELSTGHFPLQHWSPQEQAAISQRTLDFLGEQKYEGQPNFGKLLPALDQLVKHSPFITLILVTDGADKVVGTPFDSRINEIFDDWRERQQQAQMPFLTVLRGKRGVILDYTVTPVPWPLEMPALPKELQLPEVAAQKAVAKAPAPTVPPLILRGKKAEPANAAAVVSAPAGTNTAAAMAAPEMAVAQLPAPAALAPDSAAPEQSAVAPPATPPASLSSPLAASNPAPAVVAKAEPLSSPVPPRRSDPKPVPAAAAPSTSVPLTTNEPALAPATAARPPVPSSPVHHAVALSPTTPANRKGVWIAVAVLTAALLGLAVVFLRRARPAPAASLITRSLERQRK